ncbi:HEAT repeat domain-containing protein [Paenibacillus swuensis]|uniref:HEAT repeat domain-containing protein n=1 Tax=Paenibacillus swuensis TaxID=1178515 RepID=UPI000ABB571D|nr:HEAT repeat domain-containing protein [Paenibacillus swuensis]
MNNRETTTELPENFEELKKSAHRASNWRERLDAVEALGNIHASQTITMLTKIMNNDLVYKVQEAAFHSLKKLGQDAKLPSKNKPELFKGLPKILLRIKKSLPAGHTFEEFKEKLKKMRIDIYDAYEGEKGAEFDTWLEEQWSDLYSKRG